MRGEDSNPLELDRGTGGSLPLYSLNERKGRPNGELPLAVVISHGRLVVDDMFKVAVRAFRTLLGRARLDANASP